jgi:hypothetical protein
LRPRTQDSPGHAPVVCAALFNQGGSRYPENRGLESPRNPQTGMSALRSAGFPARWRLSATVPRKGFRDGHASRKSPVAARRNEAEAVKDAAASASLPRRLRLINAPRDFPRLVASNVLLFAPLTDRNL